MDGGISLGFGGSFLYFRPANRAFWGAWKGVMMQINLKMAQLLSSRLCHDLIGPVVAISGGLELMEEGMEE